MQRHYPYRPGKDLEHDHWGRRLPPLPTKPYNISRQQYKQGNILSLMTHGTNSRLSSERAKVAEQPDVKLEIIRHVEVCHGAIAGAQKVVCRVVQSATNLFNKEILALIYDPLYVDIDDLRIDYASTLISYCDC